MICPTCSTVYPEGAANCPACSASIVSPPAAVIQLKRAAQFTALLTKFEVYLDDQLVGTLGNQEEVRYEVPPGRHTLFLKLDAFKSKKGVMELAPGETIQLVCSPRAFGIGVKLEVARDRAP